MSHMKITRLPSSRWQDYKNFYLESVTDSPQAFLWNLDEINSKRDSEWQDRIKNMFFAISDSGQLIGMAGFYCEEKEKLAHIANIVRIYVCPEHRGKGIGKRLLLTVIDHIKSKPEIKKLQLEVITSQTAAYNLYKLLGFKKVGEQKMAVRVNNHFYDKYLMEMILD